MKPSLIAAAVAALLSVATVTDAANAQSPCALGRLVVDSARNEVLSVLTSGGPVVQEIRQEQGIARPGDLTPLAPVRDRAVCQRLASQFGHPMDRSASFVVLRVGPLFYAREPDQRRGTGILTDSTFKVVARFGPALP